MAWAQRDVGACKDIVFSRRIITRPVHAGSDHEPVTEAGFADLMQSGGLCWHWRAHGFHYGIAAHYAQALGAGRIVVINGSRAHAGGLQRSESLQVVEISAGAAQLAARLSQRGREDAEAVAQRLARNAGLVTLHADMKISNEGTLETAGRQLADYLLQALNPGYAVIAKGNLAA